MSTNLLISLLVAQVLAVAMFFTDAYPDIVIQLIQYALFAALGAAAMFFCIDLAARALEWMREPKARPYRPTPRKTAR
jgi:hypothetical protein